VSTVRTARATSTRMRKTPRVGVSRPGIPEAVDSPRTTGDDDAPLTEVQREVIGEVANAQRELGTEERWRKASRRDLLAGGFGGGMFAGESIRLWRPKPMDGPPPPSAKPNS